MLNVAATAADIVHLYRAQNEHPWCMCVFVVQETGVYEPNCRVRVDEFAFFIYWKSEGKVKNKNKSNCWLHSSILICETANYSGKKLPHTIDSSVLKLVKQTLCNGII